MMSALDSPSIEDTLTLRTLDFSRMFVGGYKGSNAEIIEAQLDGNHARLIHQSGTSDKIMFDAESDGIVILKLSGRDMQKLSPSQNNMRVIIPKILPTDSTIRALSDGMAIIRQPDGFYAFSFL